MGVPQVIIHFRSYKPSSYWGTPPFRKPSFVTTCGLRPEKLKNCWRAESRNNKQLGVPMIVISA